MKTILPNKPGYCTLIRTYFNLQSITVDQAVKRRLTAIFCWYTGLIQAWKPATLVVRHGQHLSGNTDIANNFCLL